MTISETAQFVGVCQEWLVSASTGGTCGLKRVEWRVIVVGVGRGRRPKSSDSRASAQRQSAAGVASTRIGMFPGSLSTEDRQRDARWPHEDYLHEVLSAEQASRHESVIRQRLREARFPEVKTLTPLTSPRPRA